MSFAWPASVRRWSLEEIEQDVAGSRADFRSRRLGEPLARYLSAFDTAAPTLAPLIDQLESVFAGGDAAAPLLRNLWKTEAGRTAFRYLGAPPISEERPEDLGRGKARRRCLGRHG